VQTLGASGFYLEKMETYALFFQEKDYQYFVFRANKSVQQSTPKNKWQVLKERILIRLKYGISS
ncbi:MAG: class I SAM-dependent methyltransferase, partial [Algoriphagus sp.]